MTLEKTLLVLVDTRYTQLRDEAIRTNLSAAASGPAQCIAANVHLSGLGDVNAAFRVAEGYLLRREPVGVGAHKSAADPSITEQHRRVTQMLFLPVTAPLREDPRFLSLCEDMGMTGYWKAAALTPDFLLNAQACW